MKLRPKLRSPPPPERGFTLIEVTVSLIVVIGCCWASWRCSTSRNKLSHVQTNIADMQQSLRRRAVRDGDG